MIDPIIGSVPHIIVSFFVLFRIGFQLVGRSGLLFLFLKMVTTFLISMTPLIIPFILSSILAMVLLKSIVDVAPICCASDDVHSSFCFIMPNSE